MQQWYEKFNFYEDPFSTKPSAFEPVGTNSLVDELAYRVNSGSLVFLEGEPGSGKTAVLKQLIKRFKGRKKVIYFDCESIAKSLNIEKLMHERHGFFGKLFRVVPTDMVLLLDSIKSLSRKNSERVKYYFDQNYVKSAVFAGENYRDAGLPESIRHRIGKRVIRMPGFNEEMAVELVRKRIGGSRLLSDEIIRKIYAYSENSPKKLLDSCSLVCQKAVESGAKEVNEEHLTPLVMANG